MVDQFNNNFIEDSVDLTVQEKYKLLLEKEMLYNELEFNPQYDESITFTHFFSVYQNFDCEIDKVEYFPFLVQCEYLNSSFLTNKAFQDPLKASPTSIIGTVKQFSGSKDDSFKKDFLENIKVYSEIIGMETTSFLLIPALAKIVDDKIIIKNKFLSVLPVFIDYLHTKEEIGYQIIKTNILNIVEELYHPNLYIQNDQETKTFLFECFVKVGKIVAKKDKEIILKVILSFANDETEEQLKKEFRFLCLRLIDKLADVLGNSICDNYFIPQLYSFSFETDSFMRMEVLNTLPSVAQEASFNLITTKLYEILQTMSKDSTYKVRKVCIETLPKIIKINKERSLKTHFNLKNSLFIDLIDILIYDNNKEVRLTVLEKIGEIIYQLTREELSMKLFDFYRNSIEEYYFNIRDKGVEGRYNSIAGMEKMVYYFAYNFPAVLYCYGAECWPQLKKIYKNLCEEKEKTIKRSIISSFHEIATIIGKEKTETDLLPIYDKYLQSTDKYEKNIAMRNLPKILQVVSKEIKETYFKYFEAMSLFKDNDNNLRKFNFVNWKNKLDVVESILCYYNLYEYDIIYKQIIPPCLTFCLDEVYLVRKTSSKVLANIISYLYINNYHKDKLITIIQSFAYNRNTQMRVIFIKMCNIFFNHYILFKEIICDILYTLLRDRLVDVKISLAKLLSTIISNDKAFLYKDKEIHKMCMILVTNEQSQTVQAYFQNKNIIEQEDKELIKNSDSKADVRPPKFKSTMNALIKEFKLQIVIEDEDETILNKKGKKNIREDDNIIFGNNEDEEEKTGENRNNKKNKIGEDQKEETELKEMKELTDIKDEEKIIKVQDTEIKQVQNVQNSQPKNDIKFEPKEEELKDGDKFNQNKPKEINEDLNLKEEIIHKDTEITEVYLHNSMNKSPVKESNNVIQIKNEIIEDKAEEKDGKENMNKCKIYDVDSHEDESFKQREKEQQFDEPIRDVILDKEKANQQHEEPIKHDILQKETVDQQELNNPILNENFPEKEEVIKKESKDIKLEYNEQLISDKSIEIKGELSQIERIKELDENTHNNILEEEAKYIQPQLKQQETIEIAMKEKEIDPCLEEKTHPAQQEHEDTQNKIINDQECLHTQDKLEEENSELQKTSDIFKEEHKEVIRIKEEIKEAKVEDREKSQVENSEGMKIGEKDEDSNKEKQDKKRKRKKNKNK